MFDITKWNKDRFEVEDIIDRWIFDETARTILKRKLLDGVSFERIAEEVDCSTKTAQNKYYRGMQIMISHVGEKKKAQKKGLIRKSVEDNNTTYLCLFGKRYIFREGWGYIGWYKA